jgi:hypothetical protein
MALIEASQEIGDRRLGLVEVSLPLPYSPIMHFLDDISLSEGLQERLPIVRVAQSEGVICFFTYQKVSECHTT